MTGRVLVVGGSGGIGGATCRRLAVAGFTPIVGYARNRLVAEKVSGATGGLALRVDLADDSSIDEALDALGHGETLEGVVLASSPKPVIGPFMDIAPAELLSQTRINIVGPVRLLAGIVRNHFRPRRRGKVVALLTAAMGQDPTQADRHMGAYLISKYGLLGVLSALQADYPWLSTYHLSPGYTETEMLNAFDPRFLELMRSRIRFSQPDDVAADIVEHMVTGR